jgi:ABC-type phosphate transport system auxiliary subunit
VSDVHLVVGVAVIALNLVAGVWGAVAWFTRRPSVSFWYILRAAQVSIVVQVLLGALLLISGREAKEGIHYMYGTAPLLVNLFAEGMRVGAAQREIGDTDFESLDAPEQRAVALRIVRREMGVMTVAALLIVAFAFRAAQVSGHLF